MPVLTACLKNRLQCRSRRREASISKVFAMIQGLLTSAPTILKHALSELQRGCCPLGVPTSRRLAADGRYVFDGDLAAPGFRAFDLNLGGIAGLLVYLLVRGRLVFDEKLRRRIRLK